MRSSRLRLALVVVSGFAASCSSPEPSGGRAAAESLAVAATPVTTHSVRGIVRQVPADGSALVVAHEEIPGLMPAMTMSFQLAAPELAQGVAAGDSIEMTLETGAQWRITAVRPAPVPAAVEDPRAMVEPPPRDPLPDERYYQVGIGQRVPDFRLITHRGEPLALSELRGKVVVLTFIYTRCPLPEACPLITSRLVELQKQLDPALRERTRILAVTIDPANDTPEVLERYATERGLDLGHATLLTGPIRPIAHLSSYFGLEFYDERPGSVLHKIRLVVVDPQGRLHAELHGPDWTVERVVGLIRQALAETSASASS